MSKISDKSECELGSKSECNECVDSLVYQDSVDWKKDIIEKEESCVRVMTYNVHGFTDQESKSTLNQILDVIKRIDSDIMIIEEFTLYRVRKVITYLQFKKFLQKLGYQTIISDRLYNNVIASKFKSEVMPTLEFEKDPVHRVLRFANLLKIDLSNYLKCRGSSDLILVGTHLDVFDETGKTRITQAEKIIDTIQNIVHNTKTNSKSSKQCGAHEPMVIVAGDFNCLRHEDYNEEEWEYICKIDEGRKVDTRRMKATENRKEDAITKFEEVNLIDASAQLHSPLNLSVWANRRVDYICGRNVLFNLATVVRITYSDHYPIYADFRP